MEAYRDGSGLYFKFYNPEVSAGSANIVKICALPQAPSPSLAEYLQDRGRDWQTIIFAEITTGAAVRFTETKDHPTGRFATNVWFLSSEEAQVVLELSNNCAAYKHRIEIMAGTTATIGRMTSSDIIQIYFQNSEGLKYYDSMLTQHEKDSPR